MGNTCSSTRSGALRQQTITTPSSSQTQQENDDSLLVQSPSSPTPTKQHNNSRHVQYGSSRIRGGSRIWDSEVEGVEGGWVDGDGDPLTPYYTTATSVSYVDQPLLATTSLHGEAYQHQHNPVVITMALPTPHQILNDINTEAEYSFSSSTTTPTTTKKATQNNNTTNASLISDLNNNISLIDKSQQDTAWLDTVETITNTSNNNNKNMSTSSMAHAPSIVGLIERMHKGESISHTERDLVREVIRVGQPYLHQHLLRQGPSSFKTNASLATTTTASRHILDNSAMLGVGSGERHAYRQTQSASAGGQSSEFGDSFDLDAFQSHDPDLARRIQEGNRLVQRTWGEAYATPGFAAKLLKRQRALNPELAASVFYKINEAKLADKLGAMINESILMLDKPDAFIPIVMKIGVKHIMYGVGDEHLDMFRDALFSLLKELMQPPRTKWDDALAKEWKRAFALMKSMMMQGRSSPQGLKETRRHDAQTHRMLLQCWKSVADREDTGLETSFVELLHNAGAKIIGNERSELFANLVARRRMFMDFMTKLFELGLKDSEAIHMLRELGARHVSYGLKQEDYTAYTDPFVETVVQCARSSTINPLVRYQLRVFWTHATATMIQGSQETRCAFSLRQAPKGAPFAIVFTDIEGSTSLWENQPVAMERAVDEHHKLVRDLIHDHNGYEVKTIGDSFMIAFKGLADAVTMALRLQVELLRANVEGLEVDGTRCEARGPTHVWNDSSVRVRVGVHWCTDATPKFDVVYKRYDYYGNDVNVAARVQDAACGGQVMCTEATLKALQALAGPIHQETGQCAQLLHLDASSNDRSARASLDDVLHTAQYMADVELKGLNAPVTLHSLTPTVLSERAFGRRNKDVFA